MNSKVCYKEKLPLDRGSFLFLKVFYSSITTGGAVKLLMVAVALRK